MGTPHRCPRYDDELIEEVNGEPKIQLDGSTLSLGRGTKAAGLKSGFHAIAVNLAGDRTDILPFRIDLRLAGTGNSDFVLLGEVSTAKLNANWPHPSFGGNFLPRSRSITAAGFNAEGFQVRLIDPVDIYRQAMRAVKYGVLFIILSFSAFFMLEHLRSLPVHPIQYLLVGLAQAVFFLRLTSLSEHITFSLAYLAAASASVLLIGIYLAAILQGWRPVWALP